MIELELLMLLHSSINRRDTNRSTRILSVFLVVSVAALSLDHPAVADDPVTGIKVSRKTTHFLEPLTARGAVDFEEAVNQHFRERVKPEENAAIPIYRVLGPAPDRTRLSPRFFKQMQMEIPPDDGKYFDGLFEWTRNQNNGNLDQQQQLNLQTEFDAILSRPWKSEEFPNSRKWLADMVKPLDILQEGVKRPKYFIPLIANQEGKEPGGLISTLLPGVQETRGLARALTARAYLHLGEGRPDDAWRDLLTCHRLGRLSGQGATLIDRLVGVAIEQIAIAGEVRYLEIAQPGPARLKRMEAQLNELPPIPPMAEAVEITERALFLDSVSMLARGQMDMGELAALGGNGRGEGGALKLMKKAVDWNVVMRMGNKWYDRIHKAMAEPDYAQRKKLLETIETDLKKEAEKSRDPKQLAIALIPGLSGKVLSEKMGQILIALLIPAMQQARSAQDRQEQTISNLRTAIALARYHRKHNTYPEKLEQLLPEFLKEVPLDLFAGEPVTYSRTDDGYHFYSIGINGIDEQGRWYDSPEPGDDPGIRMPSGKQPEKDR